MRFDREPWVKLYKHEGSQHRLISIESRSFRDFLLRFARSEDGVLLEQSSSPYRDLCRVIAADSKDVRKVKKWCEELIDVGYLTLENDGKITIKRFVEAQLARSKSAERQAKWKEKNRQHNGDEETLPVTLPGDAEGDAPKPLHKEEMRRDEMRRDAVTTPRNLDGAIGMSLETRLVKLQSDPLWGEFVEPEKWPEVQELAGAIAAGFGQKPPKLSGPRRDAATKRLLELLGMFGLNEMTEAAKRIPANTWLRDKKAISAVSIEVMRGLINAPSEQKSQTVLSP